jgi:hypothetical protein
MSDQEYTIDDLPQFSPWPARLLGAARWDPRLTTPEEVTREFDQEKWGPLLARARAAPSPPTLEDVVDWELQDAPPSLRSVGGGLKLMGGKEALSHFRDVVAQTVARYLPSSAVVELGCGYGAIILDLARRPAFRGLPFLAAEYTASGVELTRLLAAAQPVALSVAKCDFRSAEMTELSMPVGSVVFTSFATMYIPELSVDFVAALARRRPQAVVHFEPCYEHCDQTKLLGMMRRRYVEVNDYNRNLVSLLHGQERAGAIRILEEQPALCGPNPLLPASVLAWRPRYEL